MHHLLLVDDEPDNLEVLRATLTEPAYRLFEALDGEHAWEILNSTDTPFDCMVLDRMMPRLDGLSLARRMKGSARFAQLPIVMQTAAAEPEQVAEGLSLGVFCYLTKPCDPTILRAAIRAALAQSENWQALSVELSQQKTFTRMLTHADFEFKRHYQARSLAAGIGAMARDSDAVSLGMNELLSNAIEHGNLELTYQDKSTLLVTDGWQEEVQRRQEHDDYADRRVRVELRRHAQRATVRIQDEGAGFDWQSYIEVDPDRAYDLHGRGIALARQIAFQQMEYKGCGNVVQVEFEVGSAD